MLNIGRLGTDLDVIVEYYLPGHDTDGEQANTQQSKAERYYLGAKDAPQQSGRWIGSLRDELGLDSAVDVEAFRRLLEGCHPSTDEPLTHGAAQARKKRMAARRRPQRSAETMGVAQAAARLQLSPQQVRRLLERGDTLEEHAGEAWSYLQGKKVTKASRTGPGRAVWQIPTSEVERFEQDREVASMRPGFDVTLRPPKSVSILWALGHPEWSNAVEDAHRAAVDEVVDYLEANATFSRKRVGKEQLRIEAEGLIASSFDHHTSRAGDPLLHTHVVVFNMTRCVDGQWRALDGTPIYQHAKTAGYLYQAHLRHLLTKELGVRWTEVTNGTAEIVGIPEAVIDTFSKRRDEIECAVADAGFGSAKAHQAATLASRRPKAQHEPEPPVMIEQWWTEAESVGFTKEDLESCVTRAVEGSVEVGGASTREGGKLVDRLDDVFAELMSETGLTEMTSSFAGRDVLQALAEQAVDELDAKALRGLVERFFAEADPVHLNVAGVESDVVLQVDDEQGVAPSLSRWSTPELIDKETRVLLWATKGFDEDGAAARHHDIEDVLRRHPELSGEQVDMVRSLTFSGHRLHLVAGDPGSGKTYATGIAVEAFVRSDIPVVGAAVSADAASELEHSTDLAGKTGRGATTIAALLSELDDPERGGFATDTVLVLDEASMIPTRALARLVEHLDHADGSLVLLGDPNQHGAVEAGGLYQHLIKTHASHVVRLQENNRQVDEVERLAIKEYRDGQVRQALDRYADANKVVRSKTVEESYDAMAADWYVGWTNGERSPMLAGPNFMRRALNERARALLHAEGVLGEEVLIVGDREIRVGDWVVARKNDRQLRGRDKAHVQNGSIGTVVEVDLDARTVTVDFEKLGTMSLPATYLAEGNLDHAYARTTYGVQGKTYGEAGYLPTDLSSFEEGYVAITRAKNGTTIYVVEPEPQPSRPGCDDEMEWELDVDLTVKALERRNAKLLAHDLDEQVADRIVEMEID